MTDHRFFRILTSLFLVIFFVFLNQSLNGQNFSLQLLESINHSASTQLNSTIDDILEPWEGGPAYYSKWSNGPSTSANFFPIGVWLQNPQNETSVVYKNMGINVYIGLWAGPTESQLTAVAKIPSVTFSDQNFTGLTSANGSVIKSWIQTDEPDNAVSGTQNPVPTDTIVARYNKMTSNDITRPVFMGLGQGVAADFWYGRRNRTNHPEDYAQYAKGADILCFDIYPMNTFDAPAGSASWKVNFYNSVKQKPWLVAYGVDRLRKWTNYSKPVWAWIECTNFNYNPAYALTPKIVKAEVWMALIHGARGIGYFVHTITPFVEAGVLTNEPMRDGISSTNLQIISLAPALNTPSVTNGFTVASGNAEVIVDAMLKRYDGITYLFAVAMRPGTTNTTFTLRGFTGNRIIQVVGENRTLQSVNGVFQDTFADYDVHLYKIDKPTGIGDNLNPPVNKLFQNQPNPFHQSTTISYQIAQHSKVKLSVYDVLGKRLINLVDESKQPEKYETTFDATDLHSGVFICKIQVSSSENSNIYSASQRMVLIK